MKNFVEKVKDFLYDATDYMLILIIIVGVVAVIGWRLDILFAKDMDKPNEDHNKAPITDIVSNEKDNDKDIEEEKNVFDENDANNPSNDDEKVDNDDESSNDNDDDNDENTDLKPNIEEIVTFKIPSGSFPPAIANILLDKGLIDSKMDFLIKSQELKLDTKLKSGEFKIKLGTGLEELIRILAK
ncbi:MAG: hypothetical protein WDA24_01465 [Tissierellales bacterium]